MLPAPYRMRNSEDFTSAIRMGSRGASRHVVVHAAVRSEADLPKVGFVVSKTVGNSVIRSRVSRQLRHLMREHLSELHPGELVVIRALAPCARTSSSIINESLTTALARALQKARAQ